MKCIVFALLLVFSSGVPGQKKLNVVFYNVENLFDTEDDSLKNDDEFLPGGDRNWTDYRYNQKVRNIGRTLLVCCQWEIPGLIGLCEVENKKVINDLIYNSPLKELRFSSIHRESNDRRGIDVALLYQAKQFHVLSTSFYKHPDINSRDILYAKGLIAKKDTLHVFVNHWPSRYGGAVRSDPYRKSSAYLLRNKIDSIQKNNHNSMIIIMGDFNDYAQDQSLYECLDAKESGDLINLSLFADKGIGSYKMNGRWGYLDQFIVSKNLSSKENSWGIHPLKQVVFHPSFLLENDINYPGYKPKRSWIGYQYQNGFSDHLPVLLHLQKR